MVIIMYCRSIFEFFAAAARAGIVPSDFWLAANNRFFCGIAGIHEIPFPFMLSEETQFVVLLNPFGSFKLCGKGDRSHFIIDPTLLGVDNL